MDCTWFGCQKYKNMLTRLARTTGLRIRSTKYKQPTLFTKQIVETIQIQTRLYQKTPKIGVAVTILRPIKNREDQYEVLLIKRGKQPALDMWSSAGGHLE
jgi:hypothetical protein